MPSRTKARAKNQPGTKTTKGANAATKSKNEEIENEIPWIDSKARELLYKDIVDGTVPLYARECGQDGKLKMTLRDIYVSQPEVSDYWVDRFSLRLSSLRKIVQANNKRAADDQAAFDKYKENHPASLYSHKGYIQIQGSEAIKMMKEDIEAGLHRTMKKSDLWTLRPEYHTNFPLKAFRDKLRQIERTKKYMHTLKVHGKFHKAS